MHIRIGDTVKLRDGRVVHVTDAVDQSAPEVEENPDNICMGYTGTNESRVHVFPVSEVVSILA